MGKASAKTMEWLKTNKNTVITFIFLAVLTHSDGNLAMLIGILPLIYVEFCVIAIPVVFLWMWAHKSPNLKPRMRNEGRCFLKMAMAVLIAWHGIYCIHQIDNHRFQPVIEQLETYKTAHGEYPKQLHDMMQNPPSCFGLMAMPPSELAYYRSEKDGHYCITCMTFGFNHHSYCTGSTKWADWD
jgi:hypothetical protein